MSIRYEITEHFRNAIVSGQYPGGSMLPSTQKIAADFNTRAANVQRALALLVKEGLIIREQGVGTRVRGCSDELRSIAIYLNKNHMEAMNHYRQYYWTQLCRKFRAASIDYRVVVRMKTATASGRWNVWPTPGKFRRSAFWNWNRRRSNAFSIFPSRSRGSPRLRSVRTSAWTTAPS